MEKAYNYYDVFLVPQYSELKSRAEADVSVEFLGKKFNSCWIPANMKSVINENIAKWLYENNHFYIYHRFADTKAFVEQANKNAWKNISISVGVKDSDKELIRQLMCGALCVDFITIDIAHAHSILAKEMIEYIKYIYTDQDRVPMPKIIVGNICTNEAALDLQKWGADAIKVGIGGGLSCITKDQTGFHIPMFTCVQECSRGIHIPIIADGAIRHNSDIAKALVAGADLIMIGGVLSACVDAPGQNVYNAEMQITHKRYFGSASYRNKGYYKNIEGIEVDVPCNGLTYVQKYQEMKEALQSAISYAGGWNTKAFQNVKYVVTK